MNLTAAMSVAQNSTASNTSAINSTTISFRFFGIFVAFFTIFVGSFGNLLTALAYASNKKLQTTFNVFVVNLSVVDLLTATCMMPFNLAGYLQMEWPFGNDSFTARLQAFSYFSCGYTSVVFLVVITMNRFIGVFWPAEYDNFFKRKRLRIILLFCWTFAPICLLPFLIGTDPSCQNANHALTGYHPTQFLCTFICFPALGWDPYMQVIRVVFQFLPLAMMVVVYSAIFWEIHRRSKKLRRTLALGLRSTKFSIVMGTNGVVHENSRTSDKEKSPIGNARRRRTHNRTYSATETKRAKSNRRMLLISVVICITFMVTFLPSVIINLLPERHNFDPRVHMFASNLSWFNSSLNPIIYTILNPRFRKEYIRLIKAVSLKAKGKLFRDTESISRKSFRVDGEHACNTGTVVNSPLVMQHKVTMLKAGAAWV